MLFGMAKSIQEVHSMLLFAIRKCYISVGSIQLGTWLHFSTVLNTLACG